MAADTYSLLDLLLELLRDGEEAEKFAQAPDEYLKGKGLDGICAEDVRDVAPYVLDLAPVGVAHALGRDRDHDRDHRDRDRDHDRDHRDRDHDRDHRDRDHDDDGDRENVVKEITNILNNYTIDDRDTKFDQSVHQNIFAKGDVNQTFDYDTVLATGDGAVAAGGDVYGAATGDGAIAAGGNIEGDAISGDGNVTGNGNTLVAGDENIVGDENEVGNTEVDVEIDDSFNTDNSVRVEDSFNKEVDVEDSFNKELEVEDSFNDNSDNRDQSTNVDADIDIEDSFKIKEDNDEVDVDVDDSFNENEVEVE